MLTLKSGGYTTAELTALLTAIEHAQSQLPCAGNCSTCPHRLACLDLTSLVVYLQRKVTKDSKD